MPMPRIYEHASREWQAILTDAKHRKALTWDNMAYTAVDAVFRAFCRRLTGRQGLDFASILPSGFRAIFVK